MKETRPDILSLLLSREISQTETLQSADNANHSGNLSVIIDGKLLTPRETKRLIVSSYEKELGRKLSKKEANLAMQTVRRALSKSTPEFEEICRDQSTGKMAIVKGGITWGDEKHE
jgi:hypothetical protein